MKQRDEYNLGENADSLLFDALLFLEIVEDAFSSRQVQKMKLSF